MRCRHCPVPRFFEQGHPQNFVNGFLPGRENESACIDKNDVGEFRRLHHLKAVRDQRCRHDLGIDEILGTAKAEHIYGSGIQE